MRPKRRIRSIVPSLLGAALPLSVVGAGLYVVGSVSQSLCYHRQEVQYFESRETSVDSS